eukprot:c14445_g1_i1 orf=310-1017(+)
MSSMKVVSKGSIVLLGMTICAFMSKAPWLVWVLLLHATIIGFVVTISSHPALNFVHILGKSKDGYFPCWSQALFYPYLWFSRWYLYSKRKKLSEPIYNEVAKGIYVGGWPSQPSYVPPGEPAIIDCTCEFPRSEYVKNLPYMNIPTWDSSGPLPEDIQAAVQWALHRRSENRPIYIHCAYGHGRSVTVMCALLLSLNAAGTFEEAIKLIKDCRPTARLNPLQRKSFEKWLERYKK